MPDNLDNEFDEEKLSQLIESLISGTISEAQFGELSRTIEKDPAAREFYFAEIQMEADLLGLRSAQNDKPVFPPVKIDSASWATTWGRSGVFAVCLIAILAGGITYLNWGNGVSDSEGGHGDIALVSETPSDRRLDIGQPDTRDDAIELADSLLTRSVARVTNGQDLVWKVGGDISIGSWLKPGSFELTSGNLEITFDSGAVVYMAAGSAFDIVDSNEVRLLRGSLEADVPEQAIGFRVQTPSGEITDLSTKFGVKVSAKGESDVHVLKGLVEAKPSNSQEEQLVTLKENSALRMFPDSPPEPVEFSSERLFKIGSRNNQDKLNFLHFTFDEEEVADGLLKNSGPGGQGRGGKIVDGRASNSWVQVDGPFGKSLFFSGKGAKIETQIKGVEGNRPRTLMFWVRINPDTPIRKAYSFASWGLSGHSYDGHKWQIGWNPNYEEKGEGTMGAVRTEFGGGYVIGSTDLRDGRWHHIASVFLGGGQGDDVADLVRHYVDGKLESVSGSKEKRIMTRSNQRTLSIGEYIGSGEDIFTGYKGWIDEFYLFDKALTPSQIVQVMEENKPPAAEEIVAE